MRVRSGETPRSPVVKPPCVVERPGSKRGGASDQSVTSREACSVVTPVRLHGGTGGVEPLPKGRRPWTTPGTLERVSRNLPAQGARNGQKVVLGTGEIRLDAGKHKASGCQPPVPGSHDVDNQRPWETAKCRAEVGGGSSSDDDRDNITRFERRASSQVCEATSDDRGIAQGLSTHSHLGAGQRTGSDARVVHQRSWHGGMRTIDCLGESRVRENRMHGLGRGDWGGRRPGEMEYAPEGKPTGLSPSAAPATPSQFPTSPRSIRDNDSQVPGGGGTVGW